MIAAKIDRDHRAALIAAGACVKCRKPREAAPGFTSDRCAACAEQARTEARNRKRARRGIPLDAPVKLGNRGPRKPSEHTANTPDPLDVSDELALVAAEYACRVCTRQPLKRDRALRLVRDALEGSPMRGAWSEAVCAFIAGVRFARAKGAS